jgi:hypothetical protein
MRRRPLTEQPFTDPLLAALAPRLSALEPRAREVVAGLTPTQMSTNPPGGGWSVAQVFEHLVRGNEAYLPPMAATVAAAREPGAPPRPHGRSFFGGLLLRALEPSNRLRLPTTRKMTPLVVRDGVVDAFVVTLARIDALARQSDGADLRARLWSPLAPVPLNLGDAFAILVTHAERHLGQAERARRAIGA